MQNRVRPRCCESLEALRQQAKSEASEGVKGGLLPDSDAAEIGSDRELFSHSQARKRGSGSGMSSRCSRGICKRGVCVT